MVAADVGAARVAGAGRKGLPRDMLNTDPNNNTVHLFIGIMQFMQQSTGSFANFSRKNRVSFFNVVMTNCLIGQPMELPQTWRLEYDALGHSNFFDF